MSRLLGTRLAVLLPVAWAYLIVSVGVRAVLWRYEGDAALFGIMPAARIFAIGLLYDLAALAWILVPFVVNALAWPGGPIGRRGHAATAVFLNIVGLGLLGVSTVGEVLFWNEFSARFNFIAVDYLVYTREVTGNIAQSYPLATLGLLTLGAVLIATAVLYPFVWRLGLRPAPRKRFRLLTGAVYAALLAGVLFGLGEGPHALMPTPAERELAGNGAYSLFRAFRNNDLDYGRFYATLPDAKVQGVLRDELIEAGLKPDGLSDLNAFAHTVHTNGAPALKNVVLITIESLGADYVESFGGAKGLTPNLDRLTARSLTFQNLYATGLRTVRGLEAVTLSIPPTPGRAVPIRQRNRGLMSLGSVLADQGYQPLFLYGGYSYFDNMRNFFEGEGYEVRDRTDIADDRIHHETIWGVADEDLFDFTIETLDAKAKNGKPFFAHIMTTSNHRPFTYPEGRIDIPSHTGREGAAKYTDWAIGKFLDDARERPWFKDTVFVLLADHTSHGRGRVDLPLEHYRIPMWIYAPGFVGPGRVDYVASQIDVAPTLLGLLNIGYESAFFGQDILAGGVAHQRAFMANYLTVGYMEDGMVVELAPQGRVRVVRADTGRPVAPDTPEAHALIDEAISFYQTAAHEIARLTRP